jgi:hypothetical protein
MNAEKTEFPSRLHFVVLQIEHNGKMSTRKYERCYTEVNFQRILSGEKKNCLTCIGMYQPARCPKLQFPFPSLVCKSGHQREREIEREREKVTMLHQNSKHRYLKIIPNNYSISLLFVVRNSTHKHQQINPLSPQLNPTCCLLALLAHDFLHVTRIRVKSLTLR